MSSESLRRSGRLTVGIIGAGLVGPVLGKALAGAGHMISGISAVSEQSRERAETMLPGVSILMIPQLVERSDLVVIAVPTEELPSLVSGLAATGTWRAGQLVMHTAAKYGVDVLEPAVRAGAIPLAIHPAMVFTGTSIDVTRLHGIRCAVTAPTPVLPIAQALVVEMGAEPVIIDEDDREVYADAVDAATQFSRAIVEQAAGQLSQIGVQAPGRLLAPLVRSSVDTALQRVMGGDRELPEDI